MEYLGWPVILKINHLILNRTSRPVLRIWKIER
jgi:hypothetical protein